ncbi:N-acetylmuramate alpha-1-phosphate uridylyltransferase [Burkholderiales bacterium 8X]|nr:N-acetylmuramate alpha-1-phosphate uridylyltransferase [Burkholderiales bacterium 8X]
MTEQPASAAGAGHALLLAAGRGERMRPLTDTCPKPLLEVRGKPLMQWPIEALTRGGFDTIVINTAWLGDRIAAHYGHSREWTPAQRTTFRYSDEQADFGGALETAGGIVRALPLLRDIFWVVAGDVYMPDFVFEAQAVERFARGGKLGHLWLVPNPPHHPRGDFGLSSEGLATQGDGVGTADRLTFSTVGLYRRELFEAPFCDIPPGNPQGVRAPLAPLLRAAIDRRQIGAERYTGAWTDVGTPERLEALNRSVADR